MVAILTSLYRFPRIDRQFPVRTSLYRDNAGKSAEWWSGILLVDDYKAITTTVWETTFTHLAHVYTSTLPRSCCRGENERKGVHQARLKSFESQRDEDFLPLIVSDITGGPVAWSVTITICSREEERRGVVSEKWMHWHVEQTLFKQTALAMMFVLLPTVLPDGSGGSIAWRMLDATVLPNAITCLMFNKIARADISRRSKFQNKETSWII